MAQNRQLPSPIVGAGANLDPDQTTRQLGKELKHLRPPDLAANNDLAGRIHAVNLEHRLGNIQPYRNKLTHRSLLLLGRSLQRTPGVESRPQHHLRTLNRTRRAPGMGPDTE